MKLHKAKLVIAVLASTVFLFAAEPAKESKPATVYSVGKNRGMALANITWDARYLM